MRTNRSGRITPRTAGAWTLAMAVAAAAAAPALEAQTRTVIRRSVDSTGRDTTYGITVSMEPGDILRLVGELMASRQNEERIALTLRDVRSDTDAARRRELEQQLGLLARRNAGLLSTIRLQCAREDAQPDGYLGVSFVEEIEIRRVDNEPAMYLLGPNPRILSVEPGSPAQRAGLTAQDQLVSIGGNDVRRPVPLGSLLKPGTRLPVRVLRAGQQKEVVVVVGKRPDDYGSPCAGLDDLVASARWAPQASFTPRVATGTLRSKVYAATGDETRDQVRAAPGGFVFVTPFATSGPNLIGGAQILAIDAEWRETLGVDKGLLVLAVAPGSPAESAGLRKSDVIVAVGDSTVGSVGAFWQMVNRAGADALSLKVQRGRQSVAVVFKAGAPR